MEHLVSFTDSHHMVAPLRAVDMFEIRGRSSSGTRCQRLNLRQKTRTAVGATCGAEAGTGYVRSFRLQTLRCELGYRLSHPVDRAAPFRAAMLGSPSVHTVCRPTLGGGGAALARPRGELFMKN